ncbi:MULTISPECIES: ABC transporter permease [unclassified Rathayibacter]|uniref:ABC transporter permease n=1 Tax=unclassified Rathayibacter TaxID=2609250 RepID=UPI000CE846F1|nr:MULTISPECIES: ABC transporter permease [unclassified Rathayibacter]PPG00469.1 ABC transporter permease [Rathayibacter sp. AY2B1]PPG64618.1 ABC transporter permease [Rathayibacter sp. AY2B7]PPG73942.1 ABC transporter permease [Rathayibacter sp. AY1F4]PPI40558.1 ABC transporter permease [Rathayibacter sp. RFBD1]PPI59472.1 ABC transporter permease [Rathayibacter sp. TRS19]
MAVIAPPVALRTGRSGRVLRRVAAPLSVVVVLAVTLLWLSSSTLDSIEQRTLNPGYILARVGEHVVLTVTASALVAVLAIPAGIAVYRAESKVFHTVVLGLANIGQATPAVGVVILLAIVWQTGFATALVALVAYSFLPVLRNTLTGLEQVDAGVRESARGMGMTPNQVLRRIELPLASPVILAGLRTSLVFCVGVATIATFINAGGLGDMIVNGLKLQRYPVLITGAVLVACIAVLIDWAAGLVEDAVRPRGL